MVNYFPEILEQLIYLQDENISDFAINIVIGLLVFCLVFGIYFYIKELKERRKSQEKIDEILELAEELE